MNFTCSCISELNLSKVKTVNFYTVVPDMSFFIGEEQFLALILVILTF